MCIRDRSYLLRKWCEGRECNTASWDEILRSADILASLHGAMNQMEHSLTEVLDTDVGRLLRTYEKHTRELRTVRNYTRGRKNKSEFEKEFLGLYPKFEEQASEILESLREQEGKKAVSYTHLDVYKRQVRKNGALASKEPGAPYRK